MIVGPAYGWKGKDNGVEYDVYMHQWRQPESKVMKKSSTYILNIVAKNNNLPIKRLDVILPEDFELESRMVKEINWPEKNWKHVFDIRSSDNMGVYNLKFKAVDIKDDIVYFSVPLKVVEKAPSTYQLLYGDKVGNFIVIAGMITFVYFVLKYSGAL